MSVVRSFMPPNELAAALRAARPQTAREAIKRATQNLESMQGDCLNYADGLLQALEAALAQCPEAPTAADLTPIYKLAARSVGVWTLAGLPDLDTAAASLCDVIDGIGTNGLRDRRPVQVHIGSMRLLRNPALGSAAAAVLEGLEKLRTRFAAAADPTA